MPPTNANLPDINLATPMAKAAVLIEMLPYIRKFAGKTVVVKYGGSILADLSLRENILQDLVLMKLVGIQPILVHGGGPDINAMLTKLQKEILFVQGCRVTDQETLGVAEMVLSGKVNKTLVAGLHKLGAKAVGISGQDGGMITVRRRRLNGVDMGFEGDVENIDAGLVKSLMKEGFIPVVSPIGMDADGQAYNMNADAVAVALAAELQAEKLLYLTDVQGVLTDVMNPKSRISKLAPDNVEALVEMGIITGGMIPKVRYCAEAVEKGVTSVHILDGRVPHAMLLEIFTEQGIGTMIARSIKQDISEFQSPIPKVSTVSTKGVA